MENIITDYLVNNGRLDTDDAQLAAARCVRKLRQNVKLGFGLGLTVGLVTDPANVVRALIMAVATAGGGATLALLSPSCLEVRDAALKLADDEFYLRP